MIEELFELKQAMRDKKPKEEVAKKYLEYSIAYEESEKDVKDKIDFRDFTEIYWTYMYFDGRKE